MSLIENENEISERNNYIYKKIDLDLESLNEEIEQLKYLESNEDSDQEEYADQEEEQGQEEEQKAGFKKDESNQMDLDQENQNYNSIGAGKIKKLSKKKIKSQDSEEDNPVDSEEDNQDNQNLDLDIDIDLNLEKSNYQEEDFTTEILDNPLIDKQKINQKINLYLKYYYSPEMKKYYNTLKILYSKSFKKYKLITRDDYLYLVKYNTIDYKNVFDKDNIKYISRLKHPKFINVNQQLVIIDKNIIVLEKQIQKLIVDIKYAKKQEEKDKNIKELEKLKKNYKEYLGNREIYRLYYSKINNIDNTIKTKEIELPNNIFNSLESENHMNLTSVYYKMDENLINEINDFKTQQLNEFNELLELMKDSKKSKTIHEKINNYLLMNKNNDINQKINDIKKKQDNLIDYIIVELPEFN